MNGLIINADDWGRDRANTDRTLECFACRAVSAVSAMVFMEDSVRAADIACEKGIDAGLHLNFTTQFSARGVSVKLAAHQERIARYLRRSRMTQAVFHPGLAASFEYVVRMQRDEFQRLYGVEADRIDGHHHMHLCANVLFAGLLPRGARVRRNFSFIRGEKSLWNRGYRGAIDRLLARGHRLTDFFFSLPPLQPVGRLRRIFSLGGQASVELETHPVNPEEYAFLAGGEIFAFTDVVPVPFDGAAPVVGQGESS